jgi:deoxyribose-phosphate aldolase
MSFSPSLLEHTLLRADATADDVRTLCAEAKQHGFYGVCVNSSRVELASSLLQETDLKVITTIGFPLGAIDSDVKRYEIEAALDLGAQEFDVVVNIGLLKERQRKVLLRELHDLLEAAEERPVKLILETGYLDREEIALGCELAVEAGLQFVKTSTGFGPRGATVEDVRLLREICGTAIRIKASGGIKSLQQATDLLAAGADRLGTSSSVAIAKAWKDSFPV